MESPNIAIAKALVDLAVLSSRLRNGVLEITFEGGIILMVHSPGHPLCLKLITPNGILDTDVDSGGD